MESSVSRGPFVGKSSAPVAEFLHAKHTNFKAALWLKFVKISFEHGVEKKTRSYLICRVLYRGWPEKHTPRQLKYHRIALRRTNSSVHCRTGRYG